MRLSAYPDPLGEHTALPIGSLAALGKGKQGVKKGGERIGRAEKK